MAKPLILDNTLVAQEIFHFMRTNLTCKAKYVAIKNDTNKAYNRWNKILLGL